MRRRYAENYTCVAAAGVVVDDAEVVPGGNSPSSEDSPTTDNSSPASNDINGNDDADNGSYFDARGLYVPGGFARDVALDTLMERFAPHNHFSQKTSRFLQLSVLSWLCRGWSTWRMFRM